MSQMVLLRYLCGVFDDLRFLTRSNVVQRLSRDKAVRSDLAPTLELLFVYGF